MFDLWGQTVDTPTFAFEMEPAELSITEQLKWEKELTGVYLSQHPFSPYVKKAASDDTTLCGHIERDMEGQVVRVAGMVTSVRNILTRDGHVSASVMLEDLDGQVEVMMWSRIYAQVKDLCQEGNILLIEGKVRERGDQLQIVCERASRYDSNDTDRSSSQEPAVDNQVKESKALASTIFKEEDKQPAAVEKKSSGNILVSDLPESQQKTVKKKITITLQQTQDADGDIDRLHQLLDTLADYPGDDELHLLVSNGKKIFTLKMGQLRISFCPELGRRVSNVIGADSVKIESL